MKIFIASFVILMIACSISTSQQQDSNVIWSTQMWPVDEIFNSPDGNIIYCNQNQRSRFLKIDAMTGKVIDSVGGKGLIMGISPDLKYLYTCYSTFGSVKKLDINTYIPVDSINDLQDIWEKNPRFNSSLSIANAKLGNDGKLYLSFNYGKYALISLNANNLEIIGKRLTSDISDSIFSVEGLAISPVGDYIATHIWYQSFDSINHTAREWTSVDIFDKNTLSPLKNINFYAKGVFDFSPDGKFFALRDSILKIYDTKDFSLKNYMNMSLNGFDFSNDSKLIAVSVGATVRLLNLQEFSEICTQKSHTTLTLKFSSDDRFIYDFSLETGYLTKSRTCIYPVEVSESSTTEDSFISPNPASDYIEINVPRWRWGEHHSVMFTVDNSLSEGVRIFDLLGTEMQSTPVSYADTPAGGGQVRIDVSSLSPGVYFVRVGNEVRKFVKM